MTTRFDLPHTLAKINDELGVVFSWSAVSYVDGQPYVDFHGDWIPEDALIEAHLNFAEKSRAMKVDHSGKQLGTVPFVFPLVTDVKKELGISSSYSGAVVGMKPYEKATLNRFRAGGDLRGVSMGGKRILDEIVKSEGGELVGKIDVVDLGKELDFAKDAGAQGKLDALYEAAFEAVAKAAGLARNKLRRIMRKFEITEYSGVGEPAQQPAIPSLIKQRFISTEPIDVEKVAFSPPPREVVPKEPPTMDLAAALAEIENLKKQVAAANAAQTSAVAAQTAAQTEATGLKKQLEIANAVALMGPADRDHYQWLGTQSAREAFVAKGRADRDAEIKAVTIHEDGGVVYRTGEEKVVKALKENADLKKRLDAREASEAESTLAKSVMLDMSNLPGTVEARTEIRKAIGSIDDDAKRTAALGWLAKLNKACAALLKTRGVNGGDADADPNDPEVEVANIAKGLREKDPTLTEATSLAKAWESPRGQELYAAMEQAKIEKRAASGG